MSPELDPKTRMDLSEWGISSVRHVDGPAPQQRVEDEPTGTAPDRRATLGGLLVAHWRISNPQNAYPAFSAPFEIVGEGAAP
jgi:hypothetical protein